MRVAARRPLHTGFTLVELVIIVLVVLPMLAAIVGTSDLVLQTLNADARRAHVADDMRRTAERVANMLRGVVLTTVKIPARRKHVFAAIQANLHDNTVAVPKEGDLIDPRDYDDKGHKEDPYRADWKQLQYMEYDSPDDPLDCNQSSDVEFETRFGLLGLSGPRPKFRLHHVPDRGEPEPGQDDDGDGLVDEGKLVLEQSQGRASVLVDGVEAFSITFDSRLLRFEITCARRTLKRGLYRATSRHSVIVRN